MAVQSLLGGIDEQGPSGGPAHLFADAVSLVVNPSTREQIDRLWDALPSDGGAPGRWGWREDRSALSWQVSPRSRAPAFRSRPRRSRAE